MGIGLRANWHERTMAADGRLLLRRRLLPTAGSAGSSAAF